jgi:hypothetical protein
LRATQRSAWLAGEIAQLEPLEQRLLPFASVDAGLYYVMLYSPVMPRTVQARLDERSEQDLALLRNEGHSDSEAIRLALHESAELRRRKSALRLEAEAAAADPGDLAEALRVRREMDAIAAVWA